MGEEERSLSTHSTQSIYGKLKACFSSTRLLNLNETSQVFDITDAFVHVHMKNRAGTQKQSG